MEATDTTAAVVKAPAHAPSPEDFSFPKLRVAMAVVGGLTLAGFIYHSLTAKSRYKQELGTSPPPPQAYPLDHFFLFGPYPKSPQS